MFFAAVVHVPWPTTAADLSERVPSHRAAVPTWHRPVRTRRLGGQDRAWSVTRNEWAARRHISRGCLVLVGECVRSSREVRAGTPGSDEGRRQAERGWSHPRSDPNEGERGACGLGRAAARDLRPGDRHRRLPHHSPPGYVPSTTTAPSGWQQHDYPARPPEASDKYQTSSDQGSLESPGRSLCVGKNESTRQTG
jgi:hypothetical protein